MREYALNIKTAAKKEVLGMFSDKQKELERARPLFKH
jgi:hypothetical protein